VKVDAITLNEVTINDSANRNIMIVYLPNGNVETGPPVHRSVSIIERPTKMYLAM
jgi:hypothetical protein